MSYDEILPKVTKKNIFFKNNSIVLGFYACMSD